VDAPLFYVKPLGPTSSLGIAGDHQRINAALALALSFVYGNVRHGKAPLEGLQALVVDTTKPLPHLDMSPLPALIPSMAVGLDRCRWPGRCQVLHPKTCPSLTLFLDGAHTEQSVELAVRWYDEEHRKRDPNAQSALVFHCNTEKVVIDLFKHLVWDHVHHKPRFHHVCFCPVTSSRPTLADVVGAEAIIQRKSEGGIAHALPPTDRLLPLLPVVKSMWPNDSPSIGSEDAPWQSSLAEVWKTLVLYHLAQRAGKKDDISPEDSRGLLIGGHGQNVIRVLPSMSKAMASLQEAGTDVPIHVLVTGSLYLVGDAIQVAEE